MNIMLDDGLELLGDVIALERHSPFAVNENRSDRCLAGTRQ